MVIAARTALRINSIDRSSKAQGPHKTFLGKKYQFIAVLTAFAFLAGCGANGTNNGGQASLFSIQVTPKNATVAAGLTEQFRATGTYSDKSTKDVTGTVAWSTSNTSIATISASGLATAKTQGSSSVTATLDGLNGSTSFTVSAPEIVSIAVTPPSVSIAQGTTTNFTAKGTFSDGSTQDVTGTVQWNSSATNVASVSNTIPTEGTAKGLTAGTAVITASSGNVSGTASLTVTSATLNSIAVTPNGASIPLGVTQQFTATGTFSDGTSQDISDAVSWSSSATNVATITTGGVVTAVNLGSATITASSGAISGSTSLSVNAANLNSITIQPGDATCAPMTNQQFSAVGVFNDGGKRNLTSQVAWSSSDTTVATIGASNGRANALQQGQTTISATLGSVTGSTTFQVSNATISSISVAPAGRTIAPGTKQGFTATGTFSDTSTQNISDDVTWASDNNAVATVNGIGTATGIASGTANISASFGGASGSALITVSAATLTSITVSPGTSVLAPASTLTYSATGTFSDGTTQNVSDIVTWSTSDSTVATISASGLVTGESAGSATITAQLGGISDTADLVVEASPLVSIEVAPGTATVPSQFAIQFTATGTFGDGSVQGLTDSAVWTASPAAVSTVSDAGSSKGLATGVAPGTATVTAVFAGVAGSAQLQVTNATLTSITVTPSNPSIALGSSQQFTATGNFSDGSTLDLTTQVKWSSSNAGVAEIGASGIAVSAGAGTTTITASVGGVSGSAVLTVQ
jgi:trimeric autotransporter adhesin